MTFRPNASLVRPALGGLGAALLWSNFAVAQPSDTTSRIARVTVYPGVATVERVAKVPAGARRLLLTCLPATLDVQTLQISADPVVRVGEFSLVTEDRDVVSACASPLDGRIRELEDQIAAVRAEASAVQLVDSYLRSVAGAAPAGPTPGAPPAGLPPGLPSAAAPSLIVTPAPAQLAATTEALRRSGQDTYTRAHQLQRKQEALELQLKPLAAERNRSANQRARVLSVSVTLATERDAEVRLSYQVRGPSWQPGYRATLDASASSVLIERQALVAQNTGEDWSNVALTLSTGQPGRATQGRLPRPWTLDVAPPPPPLASAATPIAMAAPAPASMSRGAAASDAMPSLEISAVDKAFATEFSVPQRISVSSSGQRVTLALGNYTAPATLLTRTAPAVEEAAFLVAQMAQPPGVWPAGAVSLYRDGAYVGAGRIDFAAARSEAPAPVAAGALTAGAVTSADAASASPTVSLSFGRDELVTVRADPVQDLTGSAGFTGTRTERQTRHTYRVDNRHRNSITLQVLHAAPVSRNEKIEVTSRYQPVPAELAFSRTPGTVAWQQPLAAGASAQFTAEHTIRYPKELDVQERQ